MFQQTVQGESSSTSMLLQVRAAAGQPLSAYSAISFFEYVFYPPLYLAGPILTFNAFASQQRAPQPPNAAQVLLRLLQSCRLFVLPGITNAVSLERLSQNEIRSSTVHRRIVQAGLPSVTNLWLLK